MPGGGSRPGERRGGRRKGTPNSATAQKQAELDAALAQAFEVIPHSEIDQMTPATVMLTAMRGLVKANLIQSAISIAKEAAPYFDAKLAPKVMPPENEEGKTQGYMRVPEQAQDLEAWATEATKSLEQKSGALNWDPKPSS